ncbi:MAG: hypothetical protein IJM97_00435 [Clostridia bacterium]|nr:hypothetical protein [Clostridia bacterium]
MEIKFRKAISILLTLVIFTSSFVWNTAFAVDDKTYVASFLEIYDSYMLFQQNEPIIISGKGKKGDEITVKLVDKNNKTKRAASTKVSGNGSFKVTLDAIDGGYDEYELIGTSNGITFSTLYHIVFGEVWLCAGQSNMAYPLSSTDAGEKILKEKTGDYYIRGLIEPIFPKNTPFASGKPRSDVPGSYWAAGSKKWIASVSAVGYFFAEKLREELDVPVGILSVAIGGSSIVSWLSKKSVDENEIVKKYLEEKGEYLSEKKIPDKITNSSKAKNLMTYAYNQKVAPLKNFSIRGTLWYQGETDVNTGNDVYFEMLKTLHKSYSDFFGFENGSMPLICSNLASFHYKNNCLTQVPSFNEAQAKLALENEYITSIPIYDVPLDYKTGIKLSPGPIHPTIKKDVGNRLAKSAEALVYNSKNPTTAATAKSTEIKGRYIHIKFDNVGNGLKIKSGDDTLYGFTVCGESGVYVEAKAVVEDKDVVKVWSENVDTPIGVAYAYSEVTTNCNLFSTDKNSNDLYPVASFKICDAEATEYIQSKDWTTCEIEKSWHTITSGYAGYFDTWKLSAPEKSSASICINTDDKAFGKGSLQLNFSGTDYGSSEISVSPLMMNKDGKLFADTDRDYSDFCLMKFKVKNNSDKAIIIDRIDFITGSEISYSPAVNNELSTFVIIPPDSDWTEITLDLTTLFPYGDTLAIPMSNKVLNDITGIDFVFSHINFAEGVKCEILLDDITFSAIDCEEAKKYTLSHRVNSYKKKTKTVYSEFETLSSILI